MPQLNLVINDEMFNNLKFALKKHDPKGVLTIEGFAFNLLSDTLDDFLITVDEEKDDKIKEFEARKDRMALFRTQLDSLIQTPFYYLESRTLNLAKSRWFEWQSDVLKIPDEKIMCPECHQIGFKSYNVSDENDNYMGAKCNNCSYDYSFTHGDINYPLNYNNNELFAILIHLSKNDDFTNNIKDYYFPDQIINQTIIELVKTYEDYIEKKLNNDIEKINPQILELVDSKLRLELYEKVKSKFERINPTLNLKSLVDRDLYALGFHVKEKDSTENENND